MLSRSAVTTCHEVHPESQSRGNRVLPPARTAGVSCKISRKGRATEGWSRQKRVQLSEGSTWKQKVYQLVKCMGDTLQLIRPCPLRDNEHSMSTKGHTTEQNMTTVEEGYNTADDGGPLHIRESSGYEEQHSRSFHETS